MKTLIGPRPLTDLVLLTYLALVGCNEPPGGDHPPAERLTSVPAAPAAPANTKPPATSPSEPAANPVVVSTLEQARASLGQAVHITGKAANAKLAAAVLLEGAPLYCLELPNWPDEVSGKWVEVTGALEQTDQFKARTDAAGAISQGTAGGDLVFRKMSYEVLTAEP